MSNQKLKFQINSFKQRYNRLSRRKSIPLPTLSLQSKQLKSTSTQRYESKLRRQTKCIVNQNFKKALEILNQLKKKDPFVSSNFQNSTLYRSKQILRKKIKTNFQFYNPKINPVKFKQQIIDSIQKITQYQYQNTQRQIRFNSSKLKIFNKSMKFKNKKLAENTPNISNRYAKWDNFCSSVSYAEKKSNILPTMQIKQKVSKKYLMSKRSKSTFSLVNQNDNITGWEQKPIRYQTDYGLIEGCSDFSA